MATQKHIIVAADQDYVEVVLAGFSARKRLVRGDVHRHVGDHELKSGDALWLDDEQHWHDAPPDKRKETV